MFLNPEHDYPGHAETVVEVKDTALVHRSGKVGVYATPAMIALMEEAASESVQPFLPGGYVSVGTSIQVKHMRATAPGKSVTATSLLTSIDDRKLTFQVKAHDDKGLIGSGTHTRYIVKLDDFMSKL